MWTEHTHTHTCIHISNQWLISTDLFWQFPNQNRHTFPCPNCHAPKCMPIHFKYRCLFGLICFSRFFLSVAFVSASFQYQIMGTFSVLFRSSSFSIFGDNFNIQHVMMLGFAVWRIEFVIGEWNSCFMIFSVALIQFDWANWQAKNARMIGKIIVIFKTKTKYTCKHRRKTIN